MEAQLGRPETRVAVPMGDGQDIASIEDEATRLDAYSHTLGLPPTSNLTPKETTTTRSEPTSARLSDRLANVRDAAGEGRIEKRSA